MEVLSSYKAEVKVINLCFQCSSNARVGHGLDQPSKTLCFFLWGRGGSIRQL